MKITWQDIAEGRAFIRLSTAAKIKLCHMAGAPWNIQDPDARLSPFNIDIINRPERVKLIHGGSGLGKSMMGACEALVDLMVPGNEVAIIGATYDHAGNEFDYLYQGFTKLFGELAAAATTRLINSNSLRSHDMEIATIWGSRARAYAAAVNEGAQLLGKEFDSAILGEGSHISHETFKRKLWRALARRAKVLRNGYEKKTGRAVIMTTPDGFEGCSAALWEEVMKKTNNRPKQLEYPTVPWGESYFLLEAPNSSNPAFSKEEIETARRTLTADQFQEQFLGRMVQRSGRIIKEYDREVHTCAPPSAEEIRDMRLGIGIDTGKYFAAVLVGMKPDRSIVALAEVYNQEFSISDNAEDVKQMVVETLKAAFQTDDWNLLKDCVDLWFIDSRSQHKEDLAELLDVSISFDGTTGDTWGPTIDKVRSYFAANKLLISDSVTWLPYEIEKYHWKIKLIGQSNLGNLQGANAPAATPDHALDALRFILVQLDVVGPNPEEPKAVSFEEAWKRREEADYWSPIKGVPAGSVVEEYRQLHGGNW